MPKRATLTYASEDAPKLEESQLYVYYCKYSGRDAFITDCDIKKLPRRRADNARIIDTTQHLLRLHTTDGGVRLIRRKSGAVERQYRLNVGKLPVAYRSEADGQFLYILDDAVTTYIQTDLQRMDRVPVPPCIRKGRDGVTEAVLEIEDKAGKAALIKISADAVRLQITTNISHEAATQEVLQFLAKVLQVRLASLMLSRGMSSRNKVLAIEQLSPQQVYEKLQVYLDKLVQEAEARAKPNT